MININVGVLGHVDSGKTSLCKCLSEVLSTCALDKHKESKERGITIDLGFSSFYIKKKIKNKYTVNHKKEVQTNLQNNQSSDQNVISYYKKEDKNELHNICYDNTNIYCNEEEQQKYYDNINIKHHSNNIYSYDEEIIQICLVDCPGHHSLLKSIIMGSEITDIILLVIDINKGMQKQTIECLVLCKIINCDIIIVLNKIDLIPIHLREKKINSMKKKIQEAFYKFKSLQKLKYHIVSISANVKGSKDDKDVERNQQNLLSDDNKKNQQNLLRDDNKKDQQNLLNNDNKKDQQNLLNNDNKKDQQNLLNNDNKKDQQNLLNNDNKKDQQNLLNNDNKKDQQNLLNNDNKKDQQNLLNNDNKKDQQNLLNNDNKKDQQNLLNNDNKKDQQNLLNNDNKKDQQNLLNNDMKEDWNTLNKEHITSYNKSYQNKSSPDTTLTNKTLNIKEIINVLTNVIKIPEREISTYEDFYFLYDHSFNIKGKGTIFTGTVIKGKIKINCNVTILPINETGKVKEIQSFKKKVYEGKKGSRLSLLILNNSIKNIKKNERGVIVYEMSNISYFSMFICKVKQVEFYKKNLNNSEHFICIIGFSSTECYGYFFKKIKNINETDASKKINYKEISQEDHLFPTLSERTLNIDNKFDRKGNYLLIDKLCYDDTQKGNNNKNNNNNDNSDHSDNNNNNNNNIDHSDDIYFLVVLKRKIHCFENEKCIFLKNDEHTNCRICLYGEIIEIIDKNCTYKKDDSFVFNKQPNIYKYEEYKDLKILKEKKKKGNIDKIIDEHTIICKNLFQSSNQVIPYTDKKIFIVKSTYDEKNENTPNINTSNILHTGTIIKPFAKQGKVIVSFDEDIFYLKNDFKSYIFLLVYYKDAFSKKKVFL
ncbi:selenocysteine-specific elongation factor selB homologue, putative [Plasmodium sp. gorilla clade G3]|nr:selenocysteine-specific elongation factor selB homologue, putative [Plasmodium sp. gorilla clade G3]